MIRAIAILGLLTIGFAGSAKAANPSDTKPVLHNPEALQKKSATSVGNDPRPKPAIASRAARKIAQRTRHSDSKALRQAVIPRRSRSARAARRGSAFARRAPAPGHRVPARSEPTQYPKATAGLRRSILPGTTDSAQTAPRKSVPALIRQYATAYSVPESLVRRIVARESGFNRSARNGSFIGLMQIHIATARGLGYHGDPSGLTDPEVNLKYGVAYLANAYRVAQGDEETALLLYRTGYYREAKRQGLQAELIAAR